MTIQVGQTLPNGAIVRGIYGEPGDQPKFVLCELPHNSATPWATWRIGQQEATHHGHYFPAHAEALRDFADRIAGRSPASFGGAPSADPALTLVHAIVDELDGVAWSADTCQAIADLLIKAGYRIRDIDE